MAGIERLRGDTDSLFVRITDKRNNPVDVSNCQLVLTVSSEEEDPTDTSGQQMQVSGTYVADEPNAFEFIFTS